MIRFKHNPVDLIDISSPFGPRMHPLYGTEQFHSGDDLRETIKNKENPVYAVDDGIIKVAKADGKGVNNGFGYYVVIDHDGFHCLNAHIPRLEVRVGQTVKAGDVIGHIGQTGSVTGPHLHFEVHKGQYDIDIFQKDKNGMKRRSLDPGQFYIEKWEEILWQSLDYPEKWISCVKALQGFAEMNSNLGDIEIAKYLDDLIVKISK